MRLFRGFVTTCAVLLGEACYHAKRKAQDFWTEVDGAARYRRR